MRRSISLALALGALAGCAKAPSGQPPVTEAEATKVAAAAEANFTSGDVNKIMDQYANGGVMIDAATPDPSADRKVQTGWARNFMSMSPANYEVVGRHIQLIDGDAFISSGVERFTVAAGAARPTVSARFTDVFKRQADGRWKIIHEHVSMPPTPAAAPR